MQRSGEHQKFKSGHRTCQTEYRKFPRAYDLPASQRGQGTAVADRPPAEAHSTGIRFSLTTDRPFRIVAAGPALSETSFRLATLPLDPGLVAKLNRAHADYFAARRKAKWHAARAAQIKRHHPPVNILGGYQFSGAPAIDMSPIDPPPEWAITSRWVPTGDGAIAPDIPDFLRRGALPAILVITPALTEARL
jgi:hypothetical protein